MSTDAIYTQYIRCPKTGPKHCGELSMAGNVAENTAVLDAGDAVGFAEQENAGQNRPQSPAQTSSFSPARISPGMSSSPIRDNVDQRSRPTFRWNCTRQCPFSFDLRDSRRRVAREQELEYLRLMAESRLAVVGFSADFTFRANPVRKYKPLILEQSTRPLTIPKSPFSSRYTRK
ncbi:siaz-interacting nuclear protein isoform X4 [Ictalurus punctatus]|uniref:Siaz-interacting nuclear protein isoform X4 n=1 Tax=Ictalurus punctatus TaxID=7998 RepID=A0A2D0SLL5_ICTPU|nr:siaz-interacting nuclear protein isoform X4 [Ictalurus punctatus]